MKIKTILVSMLAVAVLASCNKTDVGHKKGSLEVSLPGAPVTMGVEDPQTAGGITPLYNDVTVYLVNGTTATAAVWSDAEIAARKKEFEQIVKPTQVIVIANKGNVTLPTGTGPLSAVATAMEALTIANQNKATANVATLDAKGNAAGDYISVQQVTLYGTTSTITDITDWDSHDAWGATVTLKALVSRFEIGTVKAGTGLTALNVEDVYINYFHTTYKKDVDQAFTNTTWPTTFTPAWATIAANTGVTSTTGTKCYAFQVFETQVPHIIFKVGGTVATGYSLTDGTTGSFSGKYITISSFKDGSTTISAIEAHKIYKVGLTGGGIEVTPGIITPDPETPKYDLAVDVKVADWSVTNLTPVL
ncbi:MAG: hypothetical protein PHD11_00535 [Bacteroidales bacterium]|nr:hypothetical protein [Bacteroidales bacterium]MDD4670744.1 hypothetical protein [Bacteroidales bacterium]